MNILTTNKTTALIVVLLALNLGLSAAVLRQRIEAGSDKGEADATATEIVEETKTAVIGEPSDLSGDVQIVSVKSMFAGKDALTFVHECQGEVKTSEVVPGGMFQDASTKYCVGKNFLSMKDAGAAEIALMSEMTSTSTEDAPILTSVTFISAHKGNLNGTLLVEYGVVPCSISEDGCGVGMVSNADTYAVNAATKEVRIIAFPGGRPIWNNAGTKAIYPVVQRGGAGCDDGPISGYDLTTDSSKALTTEVACELAPGQNPKSNTDVEGNLRPSWGPTFWTSDSTFTASILGIDGKWRQIDGAF